MIIAVPTGEIENNSIYISSRNRCIKLDKVMRYIPQAQGPERTYLYRLAKYSTDDEFAHFAQLYLIQRKDAGITLILCVLGFLGLPGIHRFYLRKYATGVMYLLSGGLIWFCTIIDLFLYRDLVNYTNMMIARKYAEYLHIRISLEVDPIPQEQTEDQEPKID